MVSKTEILGEIKRTALANGGKPLGMLRFKKETGINAYEWGQHRARFGDAQKEAGFQPNQFPPGTSQLPPATLYNRLGLIDLTEE